MFRKLSSAFSFAGSATVDFRARAAFSGNDSLGESFLSHGLTVYYKQHNPRAMPHLEDLYDAPDVVEILDAFRNVTILEIRRKIRSR